MAELEARTLPDPEVRARGIQIIGTGAVVEVMRREGRPIIVTGPGHSLIELAGLVPPAEALGNTGGAVATEEI